MFSMAASDKKQINIKQVVFNRAGHKQDYSFLRWSYQVQWSSRTSQDIEERHTKPQK
jgi:hypothetical protein